MDKLCKSGRYASLGVTPEMHRQAKVMAARRGITMIKLIAKALDTLEAMEPDLAYAVGGHAGSVTDGTDSADSIFGSSIKQEAA